MSDVLWILLAGVAMVICACILLVKFVDAVSRVFGQNAQASEEERREWHHTLQRLIEKATCGPGDAMSQHGHERLEESKIAAQERVESKRIEMGNNGPGIPEDEYATTMEEAQG